jgi:uncharacterized membrane protein
MVAQVLTVLGLVMLWQGSLVHPPEDAASQVKILLRLLHFLAGVTWIGMLYYFNLVNVGLMKALDAPTKGKVIPELMPRALFWFRWGAVFTVLSGLMYFAMYILSSDVKNANNTNNAGYNTWGMLGTWLVVVLVTYAIIYGVLQPITGALNKGAVLAVIIGIIAIAMSGTVLSLLGKEDISNKSLSIAIGGGLGIIMFLNVWVIIWPAQKKIIAWTKENATNGTPIPPESAKLARRAFLASRTNSWLSIPMLFFMAASHDYALFGR